MFQSKKIIAQPQKSEKDAIIDFDYIIFMLTNRLGFNRTEAGRSYIGKFSDMMEVYKIVYNFEKQDLIYKIDETEKEKQVSSLADL